MSDDGGSGGRASEGDSETDTVPLTVIDGEERVELAVPRGANLRETLLDADLSPYTAITERANCGGRGLCATCGVRIRESAPAPEHWHDRLADRFGYPRLSCQLTVDGPLTVELDDEKRIWGARE